jgi:cytochrome P450
MGGKRICLGKTFAEVTVRFTVPLLFHHFDFEFVSPDQSSQKAYYSAAGKIDFDLPMKLINKL